MSRTKNCHWMTHLRKWKYPTEESSSLTEPDTQNDDVLFPADHIVPYYGRLRRRNDFRGKKTEIKGKVL